MSHKFICTECGFKHFNYHDSCQGCGGKLGPYEENQGLCKYDHRGTDSALIERIDNVNIASPAHGIRELREIAREQQIEIERLKGHAEHLKATVGRFDWEMRKLRLLVTK